MSPPTSSLFSDTESVLADVDPCDEDGDEADEGVVEDELADIPGTTNGTSLDLLQSILLPFLICILTAFPVVCIPMILTEFLQGKNCGSFFKKLNRHEKVQFFDMFRGFFSCLHLAVGRHHRRRTSRCPHGLQLSRVSLSHSPYPYLLWLSC